MIHVFMPFPLFCGFRILLGQLALCALGSRAGHTLSVKACICEVMVLTASSHKIVPFIPSNNLRGLWIQ